MHMEDKKQLDLQISSEVAKGTYSNFALITHSRSEFVLDFASMLPGTPKPQVQSRVIMTPEHAKRLLMALQDNMVKYEDRFGLIDISGGQAQPGRGTFNFGDFHNLPGEEGKKS